jgi:hypothetical protein
MGGALGFPPVVLTFRGRVGPAIFYLSEPTFNMAEGSTEEWAKSHPRPFHAL